MIARTAQHGPSGGMIAGAAALGFLTGIFANMGRKAAMQAMEGIGGDWVDVLKTEHKAVRKIFDRIEATRTDQTTMRATLLLQLKHAIAKHAFQEENVIYPALHQSGMREQAEMLVQEHGEVKTCLFELTEMAKDDPAWMSRVAEFRNVIEKHMRMEEEEIFPSFHGTVGDSENAHLTSMLHKEGFQLA